MVNPRRIQTDPLPKVVVNKAANVVVNRTKDRHKKTEARKLYQREHMQRIRAKNKTLG